MYKRQDYDPKNFCWLDCHQEERCIYAIQRKAKGQTFIAIFNFSDEVQEDYLVPETSGKKYVQVLNTDWEEYGGTTKKEEKLISGGKKGLILDLPPFSGLLLLAENKTK